MRNRSSSSRTSRREGLMFRIHVRPYVYDLFLVFVGFVGFL